MSELSLCLSIPADLNPGGLVVRVAGTPDAPLFCLSDVCAVLDLANVGKVAERLDEDEKTKVLVDVSGQPLSTSITNSDAGGQQASQKLFVTEPGLYQVVMTSRVERAKAFKRWIAHEVIPSIRKHGQYPPPEGENADPVAAQLRRELANLQRMLELRERTLAVEKVAQGAVSIAGEAKATAQAALDTAQSNYGKYSVLGYLRLLGMEVTHGAAAQHGRRLSAICRGLGVEPDRIRDPRFGSVNLYPESVLADYFEAAVGVE